MRRSSLSSANGAQTIAGNVRGPIATTVTVPSGSAASRSSIASHAFLSEMRTRSLVKSCGGVNSGAVCEMLDSPSLPCCSSVSLLK